MQIWDGTMTEPSCCNTQVLLDTYLGKCSHLQVKPLKEDKLRGVQRLSILLFFLMKRSDLEITQISIQGNFQPCSLTSVTGFIGGLWVRGETRFKKQIKSCLPFLKSAKMLVLTNFLSNLTAEVQSGGACSNYENSSGSFDAKLLPLLCWSHVHEGAGW